MLNREAYTRRVSCISSRKCAISQYSPQIPNHNCKNIYHFLLFIPVQVEVVITASVFQRQEGIWGPPEGRLSQDHAKISGFWCRISRL